MPLQIVFISRIILSLFIFIFFFRGNTLKWNRSYLHDRKQYVSINGKNSPCWKITYGVPQGSILGPLLFIIYINDVQEIDKLATFILYADDANVIITGKNTL